MRYDWRTYLFSVNFYQNKIRKTFFISVRRPTIGANVNLAACPGIGRRVGDYPNIKPLVPIRYTSTTINNNNSSTSSSNNIRSNVPTKSDIDIQKENKFKQIIEQSNVDLSRNTFSFLSQFQVLAFTQMNFAKQVGTVFQNNTVHKHGNYFVYVQDLYRFAYSKVNFTRHFRVIYQQKPNDATILCHENAMNIGLMLVNITIHVWRLNIRIHFGRYM